MLPLRLTFMRMAGKLDLKSWHRWCSSQNPGCPSSLAPQVSQSPNLKENSTFMLLTSWATVAGKKMQCSAGCWGPCSWGSSTGWLYLFCSRNLSWLLRLPSLQLPPGCPQVTRSSQRTQRTLMGTTLTSVSSSR